MQQFVRSRIWRVLPVVAIVLAGFVGVVAPAQASEFSVQTIYTNTPYWFQNDRTGYCMDSPYYGAPGADEPVTQYPCAWGDVDNQVWYLQYTRVAGGMSLYLIRNNKGGLCLDPPNYGAEPDGVGLSTYPCDPNPAADNQEWYFYGDTSTDRYYVINYKSDTCLDVAGWGDGGPDARLTLFTCRSDDDHIWHVW